MDNIVETMKPKIRILNAARYLFGSGCYVATSVRKIAALAQVDPTLVIRHFGSKELLFLEAIDIIDDRVNQCLGQSADTLGENIVRFVFADDNIKHVYVELIRASGSDEVVKRMKSVLKSHFEDPVVAILKGNDKAVRASMIVAMMMGLMNSLWILRDERLLGMDVEEAVRVYGGAMQGVAEGLELITVLSLRK